jgi:hypothetical protein
MWANVWYFLASQLLTLAVAFIMSLCFESPFIQLEKLWIGALLQAIHGNNNHGKKNERISKQQSEKILDEFIERQDKSTEKKKQQINDSRQEEEKVEPHVLDNIERAINPGNVELDQNITGTMLNVSDTHTAEAEVHIQDQRPPTYEDIPEK